MRRYHALQSWQSDSTNGTTISHRSIAPSCATFTAAARTGGVDLNLLYVNDVPVAFNYGYHYQGQLFGLRVGFIASSGADGGRFGAAVPDDSGQFRTRRPRIRSGADYLDCKRPWLTRIATSYRYCHYPLDLASQIIHAKRWVESWFHAKVER